MATRNVGPKAMAKFRDDQQKFFSEHPIEGDEPTGAGVPIPGSPEPPAPQPSAEPPVPDVEPPAEPEPTEGEPPVPAPEGEPAPDPWAEYEEIEYEDEDGSKIPVRAQKSSAQKIKDAYAMKRAMTRATHYASRYRGTIEPLITSGRFEPYAQYIQLAETNPRFAQGVAEIARRAAYNLPMPWEERPQAQPTNGATAMPEGAEEYLDPRAAAEIQRLNGRLQQYDQRFAQFDQSQQMQQRAAGEAKQMMDTITYELRARYPSEFTGDLAKEGQELQRIWSEAQRLGYALQVERDPYAYPTVILMTKELLEARKGAIPPTNVPSVVAAAQAQAQEAAKNLRLQTARTTGGGSAAQPAPVKIQPPEPRYKDGRRKPVDVFAKELQSYVAKVEAQGGK